MCLNIDGLESGIASGAKPDDSQQEPVREPLCGTCSLEERPAAYLA